MKKSLFSLSLAFLGFAMSSNAQVLYSENFESAAAPALPSMWSQGLATPGASGWITGAFSSLSSWGTATGATMPAHPGQCAIVNDWDAGTAAPGGSNTSDTLKSASFDLSTATPGNAWLNYDYFYFNAVLTSSGHAESFYVLGSSNDGATWMMLDTLTDGSGWDEVWRTGHVDLSPLGTSSTCKVAFVYKDGNDKLIGIAIDNIEVTNLTAIKAANVALGYNSIYDNISKNGASLQFLATNNGVPITSLGAKYTINGGTPVTETFSSLTFTPFSNKVFTFTTPMAGAVSTMTNTVVVTITSVNGVPNGDTDSLESSTFILASTSTTRQGLLEEFSSSTCPPCAGFNQYFDPQCLVLNANTTGSNYNVIKYQMNWPSPGTDKSYNQDGNLRKGYYGVTGIPEHFVNGRQGNTTYDTAYMRAEADASHVNEAFVDMAVTYKADTANKNLYVNLKVTPRFTKSGSFHVYVALADKYYENTTNTTGQLKYYHAMRKMLPNGSGTAVSTMTDGTTQNYNFFWADSSTNWTLGSAAYPTQMSNMFWNNPLTGSELIAFVEEDGKKSILQSILAFPVPTLEVSTLSKVTGMNVYPNPVVNGLANVSFNLEAAGNVQVKVMDFTGKVVSEVISKEMNIGSQTVALPIGNVAPGNYVVVVSTPTGNNAAPLTVK